MGRGGIEREKCLIGTKLWAVLSTEIKEKVAHTLRIKKDSFQIKKVNDGYASNCYFLRLDGKKYFVKEYFKKGALAKEVSAIREMNKVKVDGIMTPIIISHNNNILI